MKIYHGSKDIIKQPEFGKGKKYNDYGMGFYCTKEIELAKEWSCGEEYDGYANIYDIFTDDLNILNLNEKNFTIIHWLTILIKNREFRLTSQIAKDAKNYLIENFSVDVDKYDAIIGYRADDSYFSFAEDFLNNAISISKLSKSMKLGNLGEQFVLKSKKSFDNLVFEGVSEAKRETYFTLKKKRDQKARSEYLNSNRTPSYAPDQLYMLDIMRQEVKADDARLR